MLLPVYVYARVLIYMHVNRSLVFVGDVAVNGTDKPHLDGVCIVTACRILYLKQFHYVIH